VRYLLALIAGAVNVACFSPFEWWFLLLHSFVIVFFLWQNARPGQSFWIGFSFGIGQFGLGVSWVYISIQTFGGMPPVLAAVCVAAFVFILSLFPALAGWLQSRFNRYGFVSRVVVITPVCFVLFEWLRGWIFTGFPWLTTGYALLQTPLSGLAPVGGVYLLSFVALTSIGTIMALIRDINKRTIFVALFVAGLWGSAWVMDQFLWSTPSGQPVSVAIIQNNVPLLEKWQPQQRQAIIFEYIEKSQRHKDKDLIVWPEGAIPDYLENLSDAFWQFLEQHPSDFAFGSLHQPEPGGDYFNSVVAAGEGLEIYNKQHLVPFGEFFPMQSLLAPVLKYLTIPMADFSPWNQHQLPLPLAGHLAAVSVCYEDAFPGEWRNQVPTAGLLLNVSEDMWFGNSLAPHQRLQMAQFRSRESERPMVRSSNNGLSSLIDWRGTVTAVAPQFKKAVIEGEIQPRQGVTPYIRFGDLPALILMLVMLMPSLLFGRRALR